jgi:hypothetical protein
MRLQVEERCKAIGVSGRAFIGKLHDCECVRPLLQGFG